MIPTFLVFMLVFMFYVVTNFAVGSNLLSGWSFQFPLGRKANKRLSKNVELLLLTFTCVFDFAENISHALFFIHNITSDISTFCLHPTQEATFMAEK